MKPTWIIGIIAVASAAILILGAAFGIVNIPGLNTIFGGNEVPDPGGAGDDNVSDASEFSYSDIYYVACVATDKTLDRDTFMMYAEQLDMKMYGTSSYYTVVADYYDNYYSDWTVESVTNYPHPSGGGRLTFWSSPDGNTGASVLVASSPGIEDLYGYPTIVITSYGDSSTMTSFLTWLLT